MMASAVDVARASLLLLDEAAGLVVLPAKSRMLCSLVVLSAAAGTAVPDDLLAQARASWAGLLN